MAKDQETARGSSVESGRLSTGLVKALKLISDEMSANGVSAKDQARSFGGAFKAMEKIPTARLSVPSHDVPVDIGRPPVDQYEILATYFNIEPIQRQRRSVVYGNNE